MTKLDTLQTELQDLYDQSEALGETIREARQKLMEARRDIILEKKLLAGNWSQQFDLPYLQLENNWNDLPELHAVTHPMMGIGTIYFEDYISLQIWNRSELHLSGASVERIREFLAENDIVLGFGCCGVSKTDDPVKLREILSLFE